MHDTEFDALLQRAGGTPRATGTAALIDASRERAPRRRGRRPLVAVSAIGAAVLLAAGASTAAWQATAPFQSVPADLYRTEHHVDVDYTTTAGFATRCEWFAELLHLSADQAAVADRAVSTGDWSGIGQRAYDRAAAVTSDPTRIRTLMDAEVGDELRSTVLAALPGVSPSALGTDRPAWNGYVYSCSTGQR